MKLIIRNRVTETGAQLAADMLLSRPLASPCVMLVRLPIVWPPVSSRLAPVLVSVAVAIGMPITMRTTLVTTEV